MASKTQFYSRQLQKLMSRTFHNEVFLISSEDEIATISGFRLGCTQKVDVTWEERNAAIGQVVYLLCVQAHHLGYTFEDICLHPAGAFSMISRAQNKKDKDKYKLFMPTSETSFNTGMELLLDLVSQLCEYLKKKFGLIEGKSKENQFYPIEKGKINKQSIKFSADAMEQWTRACKFLLI